MVGTESPIPEGILVGDEGDVVSEDTSHGMAVAGNVTYDSDDTEGHEKKQVPCWGPRCDTRSPSPSHK